MAKLNLVTITGADDKTQIADMREISNEFPFVEWGILVGDNVDYCGRFPSHSWLKELLTDFLNKPTLNLSTHFCETGVESILQGEFTRAGAVSIAPIALCTQRLQLNTHGIPHKLNAAKFLVALSTYTQTEFIIQYDEVNPHVLEASDNSNLNGQPLFDMSHGAGVLPRSWPSLPRQRAGYAGGLGPHNLDHQLPLIQAAADKAGLDTYWIDVESHVRYDRDLDLNKVRAFLKIAEPFVVRE